MYKKALVLSVLLVFAGTGLALAGQPPFTPWKCLVYDGMVWNDPASLNVIEDTGVFVTNPNSVQVSVHMRIFDKRGTEVWWGSLWDTDQQILNIPSMGFGWMPLGWALASVGYPTNGREKFTYMIYMSKPIVTKPEPKLKCVVEVKQVIYEGPVEPLEMLGGAAGGYEIKTWCEADPEIWKKCATIP